MTRPIDKPARGRLRRAFDELLTSTDSRVRGAVARRAADYPPPYPNGWYCVAVSSQLAGAQVVRARCAGHELVVFRGRDSGRVTVADAHCPHQGADLGVGGEVHGDCIRCPFHHWEFAQDGQVARIPGLERPPRIALRTWPAFEHYGMVWVYFDAERPAGPAPYPFAAHADIDEGQLVYRGEHFPNAVDMHLIEFAENSVDFQHFAAIHGNMLVPWTQVPIPFLRVRHNPSWQIDAEQPHIAYFVDKACIEVAGKPRPETGATARITFFGPGGAIWFRFDLPKLGTIKMFQTHTPVAPMRQQVYFRWYADPRIPRPLVSYVVGSWVSNWKADIAIWESKVYRRKPMLSRVDGPVMRMRKWYQQFYPAATAAASAEGAAPES